MVDKCLYACECATHPLFRSHLQQGLARLPWSLERNRPFLTALSRHADTAARKGCYTTAFEISRALLSLDRTDPLHALLNIDAYALFAAGVGDDEGAPGGGASPMGGVSSVELEWLLLLPRALRGLGLPLYPQHAAARALALRQLGRIDEANAQLERVLLLFPPLLGELASKCAPCSADALGAKEGWGGALGAVGLGGEINGRSNGAALSQFIRLTVEQQAPLWKKAPNWKWLVSVSAHLGERLRSADAETRSLCADCAAVRRVEYGGASITFEEIDEANVFGGELPPQLPADEDGGGFGGGGAAAQPWVRAQPRLPGRLVVPRHERTQVFDFSTQTPISPICRTPLFPISQNSFFFTAHEGDSPTQALLLLSHPLGHASSTVTRSQ